MLTWTSYDTSIALVGALCAMACALLGVFLVLRKMSMMGDAISHAVLPGLAVAFLLTDSRDSGAMFLGAAAVGILTALFTQTIHRFGRVEESAAMGVVFTTLFAVGLVLIVRAADSVDLDAECVLQGAIELVFLDTVQIVGVTIPRTALTIGAVLIVDAIVVAALWKELKISSFDPALATTQGIHATLMHYLLMVMVAVTTVASFEAVGSILVIAMLIVPAATACLLSDRLGIVVLLSLAIAAASAVLGHYAAITVPAWFGFEDTTTAGMMAATVGLFFGTAFLFAPRHGVLSKLVHRFNLGLRITGEDLLGMLYRLEERHLAPAADALPRMAGEAIREAPWRLHLVLRLLRRQGQIALRDQRWQLTDRGREAANQLIRSHRLWEAYIDQLARQSGHQQHFAAEQLEHVTDTGTRAALAQRLGSPEADPQGKRIPPDEAG